MVVLLWHAAAPFGFLWLYGLANVAVWLFFLLSGYVLTLGWDGRLAVFLLRRLVRLWPVYAACLAVGYALAGAPPVWTEFLWFPLIGPNDKPAIDPPVWSLFLEVWAMPFMPLIVRVGRARLLPAAVCAVALLALAMVSFLQIAVLPALITGAYLSRHPLRSRWLEASWCQWLGRVSYSLYLSHVLVLELAVRALGPWGGVTALPLALAVGWLVWRVLERPSIWASRRVGRFLGGAQPVAAVVSAPA